MNLNIIEQGLTRLHSLPANFGFFSYELLQGEPKITKLTGGTFTEKKQNKGYITLLRKKDWGKRDKSQDRTYYVTDEQAAQFEREYIEQTGNCPKCEGERVELVSCGVLKAPPIRNDGEGSYSTFRTCSKCKGTGKA